VASLKRERAKKAWRLQKAKEEERQLRLPFVEKAKE
jgi:hypothetical protein